MIQELLKSAAYATVARGVPRVLGFLGIIVLLEVSVLLFRVIFVWSMWAICCKQSR
jgi:hypothetical protein